MKILIIALSGIGDALMFTPALKLLKESLPDAEIDALVMFEGAVDVFKNNPNINNVHHFNFISEGYSKSLKFILRLSGKYDISINVYPSNRKEYNIISQLIGANKRAAVKYLRRDIRNFGFLNNIRVRENDSAHNAETNIKMCEVLLNKKFENYPSLGIYFDDDDYKYSKFFFIENKIDDKEIVIGFHPGCATLKNHFKRRWEPEKFSELGRKLIKEFDAKVLIFGGPDEAGLKEKVYRGINSPASQIIDTENLLQSASIMKRCNVFVTNDSSQMHIAAALGLNVVAIIGPTNSNYIYPWKTKHEIVSLNLECSPCFYYSPRPLICSRNDIKFKCIKDLTVDLVYKAVKKFL
jgi:lipopolysaccharide heptosyltransferase II